MTDWQQPLVVALTQANGLSIVHETVYENRFGFTKPLVEMGATIQLYRECLGSLPDLRGGFSHLIAALAASGPSDVHGISLIDRGYADFRGKLEALGAYFYYFGRSASPTFEGSRDFVLQQPVRLERDGHAVEAFLQ